MPRSPRWMPRCARQRDDAEGPALPVAVEQVVVLPAAAVRGAAASRRCARRAKALGYSYMDVISGAGHDAVYMARVAPAAMIFVPCKDGISHNEIEDAQARAPRGRLQRAAARDAARREPHRSEVSMKILIARMNHETNTFSPVATPLDAFGRDGPTLRRGRASRNKGMRTAMSARSSTRPGARARRSSRRYRRRPIRAGRIDDRRMTMTDRANAIVDAAERLRCGDARPARCDGAENSTTARASCSTRRVLRARGADRGGARPARQHHGRRWSTTPT